MSQIISLSSGVATLCKNEIVPIKAEEGLSGKLVQPECRDFVGCYGDIQMPDERLKQLDAEGRALITQFKLKVDIILLQ
jgi:hypothetical protein